jgi:hypothetical protein
MRMLLDDVGASASSPEDVDDELPADPTTGGAGEASGLGDELAALWAIDGRTT